MLVSARPLVLRERSFFWVAAAAAPALLLVGHLLPPSGPGLALRLAGAAGCVLLLPGAMLLRAVAWPSAPAVAIAASFALSLAVTSFALALVFALDASIVLAAGVLVAVSVIAAVPAAFRRQAHAAQPPERHAIVAVLGVSVPFAGAVWWAAGPVWGDGFFHLARARKLAELDTLSTLTTVAEFKDGRLHPGYGFPLWHAVDALVARFAGVEIADVVLYLPAILVPLAFVLAYAAGSIVFDSRAGGFAFVAAELAYSASPAAWASTSEPANSSFWLSQARRACCSCSRPPSHWRLHSPSWERGSCSPPSWPLALP